MFSIEPKFTPKDLKSSLNAFLVILASMMLFECNILQMLIFSLLVMSLIIASRDFIIITSKDWIAVQGAEVVHGVLFTL